MTQATQWPSFIIQAIILGTNLYFLVESESGANIWIFLSLAGVLSVFSLQTTSIGFLHLYPVRVDEEKKVHSAVGIDTWILRLFLMISLTFLYLGILKDYYTFWSQGWLIVIGLMVIFVIPLICNMGINNWMRNKAAKKLDHNNNNL